jgi:hypothetical protein
MIKKGSSNGEEAGLFEASLFVDTTASGVGARIQGGY